MTALSYDDILLYPQQGVVSSRKDVDISASLNGWQFRMPIMSSPMETVTDARFAARMHALGVLGVVHRFGNPDERNIAYDYDPLAIALGGVELYGLNSVADHVDIVVLDVAHSDTKVMLKGVEDFKRRYPDKFLIVGSIATYNAARRAINAGADALLAAL